MPPARENPTPFKCTSPAIPTVQQDDAAVRVTPWDLAPGATTEWHSHGWPYFVVLLTDAYGASAFALRAPADKPRLTHPANCECRGR